MYSTAIYHDFDELPPCCLELLEAAEKADFFLGARWFRNFTRNTLQPGAQVHIYAVTDAFAPPRARGLLLARSPAGQEGSEFGGLGLGADTLASMSGHQSVCFAPVLAESEPDHAEIVAALIGAVRADPAGWKVVDLNLLDPSSPVFAALVDGLRRHGMVVRTYVYRPNIHEHLGGASFADFVATRPSQVRQNYRRKSRKLQKAGQLRLRLVRDNADLPSALTDYEQILARSWKDTEPFPQHTRGLVHGAAKAGALRLGLLYFDEQPVAAQIWIVSGSRATIYKLHYDQAYRQQSVGSVLTLLMFEQILDGDHVDEVSFGVGDEPAKRHWLTDRRPLCGVVAFDPRTVTGLRALFRFAANNIARAVRLRLKQTVMPLLRRARPTRQT